MKKAIIIGSLFSINFLLKLWFSLEIEFNNDELFSLYHAQMSLKNIISQLSTGNNPPLFELLMHFWIKLSGIQSHFLVRLPSLIFSAFTVILIFKIGNELHGVKVGIVSSILFTFSQFANETGILFRAYPLFVFLITANYLAFQRVFILGTKKRKLWIFIWIITETCAWYTHYFSIWVILTQGFLLLVTDKSKLFSFIKISCLPVILFSPFIPILLQRFLNSSNGTWVNPAPYDAIYLSIWKFSNKPYIAVLFIIAILYSSFTFITQKNRIGISTFGWYFMPTVCMFLISIPSPFSVPMFTDLYLYFTSPALYLLVAFALVRSIEKLRPQKQVYLFTVPMTLFVVSFFPVRIKNTLKDIEPALLKNQTISLFPASSCFSYMYYFNKPKFQSVQQTNIYKNISHLLQKSNVYMMDSTVFKYDTLKSPTDCVLLNFEVNRTIDTNILNQWISKNGFLPIEVYYSKHNFEMIRYRN